MYSMLQDMVDSGVQGNVNVGISLEHLSKWAAFAGGNNTDDFGPKGLLLVLQVGPEHTAILSFS